MPSTAMLGREEVLPSEIFLKQMDLDLPDSCWMRNAFRFILYFNIREKWRERKGRGSEDEDND
jgi:hypothetical protein